MLKEIYSLDNISIIKEIDKERIYRKNRHLLSLKIEIIYEIIVDQLTDPILNHKIEVFKEQIEIEICSNLPTAFWYRHRHIVKLPYEKDFNERQVPTKARPIQMNNELLEHCKKEIEDLLNKGLEPVCLGVLRELNARLSNRRNQNMFGQAKFVGLRF